MCYYISVFFLKMKKEKQIMDKNPNAGHRERLRQRFLKHGLDGFEEHEVLELLLFQFLPYKDTNKIAHRLIDRFGSLANVLDAEYDSLVEIDGISHVTAVNLAIYKHILSRYTKGKADGRSIARLSDLIDYSKEILQESSYERLVAVFTDSRTHVINKAEYTSNDKSAIQIDIRRIVKEAMANNAAGVVIIHCHVKGESKPSQNDITYTNTLKQVLSGIGMVLLEHLIYNEKGELFSFIKNGLLGE